MILWGLGFQLLWGGLPRLPEQELTYCEAIGMAQVGGPVMVRGPYVKCYRERLGGALYGMMGGLERQSVAAAERRRTWWRLQLALMGVRIHGPQWEHEWLDEIELCHDLMVIEAREVTA